MSDIQNCDLTKEHLMKQQETQALDSLKPATNAGTSADLETSSSTVSGSSAENAGSGTKSETPRTDAALTDARRDHGDMWGSGVLKFSRQLEQELNAAKVENARLTARMAKIENELTAAYMCGFHRRDDEVARLAKDRDEAGRALKTLVESFQKIGSRLPSDGKEFCNSVFAQFDERDELRAKLADAEKALSEIRHANTGEYGEVSNTTIGAILDKLSQAIKPSKGVEK